MIAASFAAAENVTYPQLAKLLPVYTLSPRVWPDRSPPAATNKDTLTAVRSRLSGLAVHPRRVLHGPAAPDWRGGIRVGGRISHLIYLYTQ